MCGIVGFASAYMGGFSKQEVDAFADMLFFDTLRGWDSTGVFGVDKHKNVGIWKEASDGGSFIRRPEFNEYKQALIRAGVFAVGHNRAATRGTITDKNAHPFVVDDKIVLVQNGTYKGSHKHHKDTEVDTEAVAHVISENEDITTALKKINAAYALVWFNAETGKLHMIRNPERPLWLLELTSGGLMWASEPGFMENAADRHGLKYTQQSYMLEANVLVTLSLKAHSWERGDEKLQCAYEAPFCHSNATNVYTDNRRVDLPDWDYMVDETVSYQGHHENVTRFPYTRPQAEQVDRALIEIIASESPELFLSIGDALEIAETLRTGDHSKEIFIELNDYIPANKHPNCTTWHMSASTTTPDGKMDRVTFHWFVYNKTSEQMLDYLENEWYTANIVAVRTLTASPGHMVVTCLMTNVKPFYTETLIPH
jgi:hypothetical protein